MSQVSLEAMWAVLVSVALVVGGLLLLALLLRVTTLGGATAGGLGGHVGWVAVQAELGALVRGQILPGRLGAGQIIGGSAPVAAAGWGVWAGLAKL